MSLVTASQPLLEPTHSPEYGERGEMERAVRREEQGRQLHRALPRVVRDVTVGNEVAWRSVGRDGDGDERRDRRREGGAPRGADAADAAVGFEREAAAITYEEEEL